MSSVLTLKMAPSCHSIEYTTIIKVYTQYYEQTSTHEEDETLIFGLPCHTQMLESLNEQKIGTKHLVPLFQQFIYNLSPPAEDFLTSLQRDAT